MGSRRAEILAELQAEVLRLQGIKPADHCEIDIGLGEITNSFPQGSFPTGAIHEFLSSEKESSASSSGFIAGILSSLLATNGTAIWISASRTLFPPALQHFGVQPDRIIFIDLKKEKEILWVMEEALKCGALKAVVGEIRNISFTESRRLQLAVEHSKVTGFVLRNQCHHPGVTACISRWRISPLPSSTVDDLPGIGFQKWNVELIRIRNGKPGSWKIQWSGRKFVPIISSQDDIQKFVKKVG